MRVVADLQLHSRFAMATSKNMDLEHIAEGAKMKGLDLVGTGDFTHPDWFGELRSKLEEHEDGGLFAYAGITWMLTGEVSTVYQQDGKTRKVHHLLYSPDFDVASQVNDTLSKFGDLSSDGRPVLTGLDSSELVERTSAISDDVVVIPAHCLLPHEMIITNPEAKQICEAKVGDRVLTHTGNFRPIRQVFERSYFGAVHKITPWYFGTGLEVTTEHPFLAIKTVKNCNGGGGICKPSSIHTRNCYHHYYKEYRPQWISAGNLLVGDVILYPRITREIDVAKSPIRFDSAGLNRELKANLSFCRLAGYYLAEGYSNGRDAIGFTFGKNETRYVKDVRKLVAETLGVTPKAGRTKGDILFYSKSIMKLFESLFYRPGRRIASNKCLPKWMLFLPRRKQAEIFRGWWRGDKGSSSSRLLFEQMKIICLRLGIVPCTRVDRSEEHKRRGPHLIGDRIVQAKHDNYVMEHLAFFEDKFRMLSDNEFKRFKPRTEKRHGWIDERYVYLPIRAISRRNYSGRVYNLEVEKDNSYVTEAACVHNCWTPWFSVFGSKSGFNSLRECYGDQVKRIFAIETGLSSDPQMNWRLSQLDGVALVSNSDAHSPNPWRLGREANVFELGRLSYQEVFDSIRKKDASRFLFTIEVDPAYGKYHYTGHKKCGVSLPPAESRRLGDKCPKCGRKLTVGVLERVEELADRPEGYTPQGAIPYKRLLPLYEVISYATGVNRLYAKGVIDEQDKLIRRFGSEFAVLLEADREALAAETKAIIADAIIAVREGKVEVVPGYDGVYGIPVFR